MRHDGLSFLTGRVWDPNTGQHGIAGEIWGTLYTSILALVIGTAFGLAAALFLSEGYMGQAIFALLRVFNLHLNPFWSKVPDKVEDLLKHVDRIAGGDSQRGLRPVGIVRRNPADSSGLQLAAPETRLAGAVLHRSERSRRTAGGDRAGHHDSAHHHGHQPRRAGLGSTQAAHGRLWPGSDALGDDHRR